MKLISLICKCTFLLVHIIIWEKDQCPDMLLWLYPMHMPSPGVWWTVCILQTKTLWPTWPCTHLIHPLSSQCASSSVELDCHLLAQTFISTAWNHPLLAALVADSCQDPSPLLCSRACYCCSLLVFPGKDSVQSDVSVTFNEHNSQLRACSSGRPSSARGYSLLFSQEFIINVLHALIWFFNSMFV